MNLTKRVDLPIWNNNWNDLFAEDQIVRENEFNNSYLKLMNMIKAELDI